MWAIFGFSTLIISIVMLGIHRYESKWSGIFANNCYYKEGRNQKTKKLYWIEIGVSTNSILDFELKKESWLDRVFKAVGLSKEGLIGKDELERNIYVVSDDERVFSVLNNANMHQELQYFFDSRLHPGFRLKRIVCRAGKIRARFKVLDSDSDYFYLMKLVQPHLRALDELLPDQLLIDEPQRDPYFLKSILLLATSSGLAINGLVQLLRLGFMKVPFIVDTWQLWTMSLFYAAGVVFVLVTGTVVLLARTSRAHLVLFEVLLVGGIGAVMSCVVHLRDLNIDLDSTPASTFNTQVIDKHISRSRKGGTSYYITLAPWNENSSSKRVKVSYTDYGLYAIGGEVDVYQKPGYLNIRWVERIERK